ncbi:hypothetical protein MSG28_008618 [Choristoneura fumiferana]|uniref:Uncharacterized protein n=1 Tax=Choristoneura fumiferana TaxID=7141 RepID=A0ACC0J7D8_CHOFU|nr:hypothetical protein MSG28_008618 [Choristoneura fumiferana]
MSHVTADLGRPSRKSSVSDTRSRFKSEYHLGRSLTSSYVATLALGATLPLAVGWELAAAGGAWRAAAGLLAALGWALAAADAAPALAWLTAKLRTDGFSVIRNIPDLDEQSEALMSSDEPT